ncbi:hypothetical protein PR202_gb03985 [Eleusine coracana subsp. coracana]|uniref:Regulatory protein viviparous-1 n=1 Tax=Eleusine coracana subsp. coracana TaxID=191504 RepID=A0AAV5E2V5_ELECO|nr:hypothetical protein PR202_gb03985 [Eleusine coracana subsp. coracana]
MDASAGSPPPHSQGNHPANKHGGGGRGEEIGGGADDFMFADDTFPSLPDFPCLSSPSSSTYSSSSSSSSNSSSAYTTNTAGGGGGGEPSEPASAAEGFDALEDIDQILDFASLSVPWDSEPLFPDVGMMIEDAMSAPPHPVGDFPADGGRGHGKALLEGAAGGEEEACMGTAGDDLARFFMEWLTNNRESISAEDLRGIRLRRSTIEAAAARLGGGRQGTMQLLKLILTWVQNYHLQKKRPRGGATEDAAPASSGSQHGHHAHQLSSPPDVAAATTSWAPYQQSFTPSPTAYGEGNTVYPSGGQQQYTFHHQQSCGTSSVVVNSQPFSPPPAAAVVGDMHAASGGGNTTTISWPQAHQQYVQFPAGASSSTGGSPYPMAAAARVVPHHQPFAPAAAGFAGPHQYSMGSQQQQQRMVVGVVEASATKEARKKRMAKQRRLSCLQQQRSQQLTLGQIQQGAAAAGVLPQEPSPRAAHSAPVTPSAAGGWFWPSGVQQQIRNPLSKSNSSTPMLQQQVSSPAEATKSASSSARKEQSPQRASDKRQSGSKADKNLRFLLQKVLKQSDVGSLGRIVLPKKEAEIHLPELKTRDGISIPMEDIGTSRLIRGVKVRPAQEQAYGSGVLGKHKERPGASGSEDGGGIVDGTGKPDGACKSRPPHAVRRARQEAAAMGQMAVSI